MKIPYPLLVSHLAGFALGMFALHAAATTYYVSAGHDSGSGTQESPWGTVQQAADVATAGDTVIIADGNYPENVVVKNSGTEGNPITFRSQNHYGAVLQAIVSKSTSGDPKGAWLSFWVTLQGIHFNSPASNGTNHAVYPTTGWDIEDCLIEGHNEVGMEGPMTIKMGNITVRHCVFQDCYACSFGGYSGLKTPDDLLHDVLVQNCIVRRSNLSNVTNTGWDGAVNKFFNSKDVAMDGVIAYDNNGCSLWFDTNNQNFKVTNCTVFGNHSGWFYDSGDAEHENEIANGGKKLWDNTTCSFAIDTEANQGPGLIENNVCYSNVQGRGVVQACSGNGYQVNGDHQIKIIHNTFADNQFQIGFWAQVGPEKTRGLGDTLISDNTIYGWDALAVQCYGTKKAPGDYPVVMSHNTYDAGSHATGPWGQWDFYKNVMAKSLDDMQNLLHLEDGTSTQKNLGAFRGQLPAGTITISPSRAAVEAAQPGPCPAISELKTPTSSIDDQLKDLPADQAIHTAATITVYGHTPLVADATGALACEAYDFQGRWVMLTVAATNRDAFEQLVLPYATLAGVDLKVNVTMKSAYKVTAEFAGS